MNRFNFTMGTKIYFGVGRIEEIGEIIRSNFNICRSLIISGQHCINSGLVKRIKNSLKAAGINELMHVGGSFPIAAAIDEIVSDNKDYNIELIIAVGGGSVIDVAKGVSACIASEYGIWDLVEGRKQIYKALPVVAVVTNPASGSESNGSTVITNESIRVKRGLTSDLLIPKCAILDPQLTCSLSKEETVRSATDIMFHTIERFLSTDSKESSLSDKFAISVLNDTITNLPIAINEPENIEARSELLWCGTCSNCGLTGLGNKVEFPIHQLGHQVTAHFGVPHADSLTSLWKPWADYVLESHQGRFASLGRQLFGIDYDTDLSIGRETVDRLYEFWKDLGMPMSLTRSCGRLSDEDLRVLVNSITNHGKRIIGNYWNLSCMDVRSIIERAAI